MTHQQLDLFYRDATTILSKHCAEGVVFTPIEEASVLVGSILKRLPKTGMIRVLEPSSGTGNLILAILNILSEKGVEPSRVEIVSCELNREYLKLQKAFVSAHFKPWERSIEYVPGDFLERYQTEEKFDFVIMNPPWVGYRNISIGDKNYIKQTFALSGQFDLLDPFVLKCFQLLKNEGKMAMFLPDKVLSSHQPSNSVNLIKPMCEKFEAKKLPKDFFDGIQHESVFLSLEKSSKKLFSVPKIEKNGAPTIGDFFDLFRGFEISGRSSEHIVTDKGYALDSKRPFISGQEMTAEGKIKLDQPKYISNKVPHQLIKEQFEYKGPAILVRKTGSPVHVCYVEELPHVSQVVFVIIPRENTLNTKKALKQLTTFLQSPAGQKLLSKNSGKLERSLFPYVTISDIKSITLNARAIDLNLFRKAV
jgi:methylase of polypeptide subunit release factors